jgi:serine/threonine protein kinase
MATHVPVRCRNPACAREGRVPAAYRGQTVRCTRCGQQFLVPLEDEPGRADSSAETVVFRMTPPVVEWWVEGGTSLPRRVGRFVPRAEIGRGAFGIVYRAYDPQLDREVALKVSQAGVLDTPQRVARFLREGRAAARLLHPHIVPIYDAGQDGEAYYIASAFIPGQTLAAACAGGPFAPARAAGVVRALADALGYAHQQGIVHRDVKPANVILDEEDRPHLTDFGLAVRRQDERLTELGVILGTPPYLPPEQAAQGSAAVCPAGDQYSLGVVLFELLCGRVPFLGEIGEVLSQIAFEPPPPPRSLRPEVAEELEAICLRTLAKDPEKRFASCREFADKLGAWLAAC